MRALLVVIAAFVAAATAQAGTPGFTRDRSLEPAASFVAHKPVKVWCATTAAAWRVLAPSPAEHGAALPGGGEMFLDNQTCKPLETALHKSGAIYQPTLAGMIEVLTHESIHLRGERDEGVTDCAAMHEMPDVAVRYFSVVPGAQLRRLMAAAWAWHRQGPATSPYRAVC